LLQTLKAVLSSGWLKCFSSCCQEQAVVYSLQQLLKRLGNSQRWQCLWGPRGHHVLAAALCAGGGSTWTL